MSENPEVVLCVPGPWETPRQLADRLAGSDHPLVGERLVSPTGIDLALQLEERDPRMALAFTAAGRHRMAETELATIADHRLVAYVIGEGGSLEFVRALSRAACALLDAGGIGVKVESAGVAYGRQRWADLTSAGISVLLQRAFVTYVGDGGETWSCGMHAFGLRDAVITASRDSADVVRSFTEYLVGESPEILAGQTFSPSTNEPSYLIRQERCTRYSVGDLFHNPFGYWRLVVSS
jgi:hypothetical protein